MPRSSLQKSSPETNYRLVISYRGTRFRGWQKQGSSPTIQLEIEQVLSRLWSRPIIIHGSGRTDTGVHALGQIAHFHAPLRFKDTRKLRNALNAYLPDDIRILDVRKVLDDFHSRFSATSKEYEYLLFCREVADPMELNRSWHLRRKLDLSSMKQAAALLLGTHDFASFASNPGYSRETTVRTLHRIQITQKGPRIRIRYHGSGFLYRMVRNLTGALVRVGDGRLNIEEIAKILKAKNRSEAPPPAPAHGLYLVKVHYRK